MNIVKIFTEKWSIKFWKDIVLLAERKKTFSRLYDKTRCPYFGVNRYDCICTEQEKDDHKYKKKVFFTADKVLVFT